MQSSGFQVAKLLQKKKRMKVQKDLLPVGMHKWFAVTFLVAVVSQGNSKPVAENCSGFLTP